MVQQLAHNNQTISSSLSDASRVHNNSFLSPIVPLLPPLIFPLLSLDYTNNSPSPTINHSPSPSTNRSPSPYNNRSPSLYTNRSPSLYTNRSPSPSTNRSSSPIPPPLICHTYLVHFTIRPAANLFQNIKLLLRVPPLDNVQNPSIGWHFETKNSKCLFLMQKTEQEKFNHNHFYLGIG